MSSLFFRGGLALAGSVEEVSGGVVDALLIAGVLRIAGLGGGWKSAGRVDPVDERHLRELFGRVSRRQLQPMNGALVGRQEMSGERALAAHHTAIGRFPGGAFVMVHGQLVCGVGQNRIGVGAGPLEIRGQACRCRSGRCWAGCGSEIEFSARRGLSSRNSAADSARSGRRARMTAGMAEGDGGP